MNRLSIINGGLSIQKQNIKQAVYFDYLKSFSEGGLQTLERLQKQFNKYVNKSSDSEQTKLFKKIKTLISTYQVFVIQMNDSCQFIQVPQFGSCILKVFIQLIAILKWSLKMIQNNKKQEAEKVQEKIFTAKRDSNIMRMTFNGVFNQTMKEPNRCSQCLKNGSSTPRNMFRLKQQTTLHLKDISEQIKRINVQYAEAQKHDKQHQKEERLLKKFIQKRDENFNPHYSKNEEVLSQILAALSRKGQNIARFADMRINCLNQINKSQTNEQEYQKVKKEFTQEIAQKVQDAKHKLKQLFKQHIQQHQKQKRLNGVEFGVQINQQDTSKFNKIHQTKMIKKLKGDIKKLQKDLQYERSILSCLKQLLEDKSVQYQTQIMKYRTQFVCAQLKSKRSLKSQKTVQNQITNQDQSQQRSKNSSMISIDFSQDTNSKGVFKIGEKQHEFRRSKDSDSFAVNTQQMKTNTKFKNIIKTKKSTKFNLHCSQLDIDSSVIVYVYVPEDNGVGRSKFTCLSRSSSKVKTAFFQNGQDTDYFYEEQNQSQATKKFRTQLDKEIQTQPQTNSKILKPKKTNESPQLQLNMNKTHIHNRSIANLSANKRNVVSYLKKRSSHMGELAQRFQIQHNSENINTQDINTNRSVLNLINIKTKQNFASNDFFALNISQSRKPKFQINKNVVFTNQDISTLFLSAQNAQSYQWFSLQRQVAIPLSLQKKKVVHYNISAVDASWSYRDSLKNKGIKEKMVSYLLNQIKILKIKNKKIFQNLKTFLRFPYSYVNKGQNERNILFQDNSNIQYTQMCKIITRILKIHECCSSPLQSQGQYVCHHLLAFYQKIGIKLQ